MSTLKEYKVGLFKGANTLIISKIIKAENSKEAKKEFFKYRYEIGLIFFKNLKNWIGVKRIK